MEFGPGPVWKKNSSLPDMKRIVIVVLLILVILTAGAYLLLPENLKVSQITIINCTPKGSYRMLTDESNWHKWWPQKTNLASGAEEESFFINDASFKINGKLANGLDLHIQLGKLSLKGTMIILPLPGDSIAIRWQSTIPSGNDPFTRINRYRSAMELKTTFSNLSGSLKQYLERKENIYDFSISNSSTQDTLLIAAKSISKVKPGTIEVYKMLYSLQNYMQGKGAKQNGYPMTNTTQLADSSFQLMVGIPTDKELPEKENMFPRKMIKGNFLVTEVTGGPSTVNEALKQLQFYAEDYRRVAIAIPFESLVTDRLKVTDTTKWKTRVYFPVM